MVVTRSRLRRWLAATAAASVVLSARMSVAAERASADAVKAAFLFNFAKFVQWPIDAMPPERRITLCVVGDPALADALNTIVKGQTIEGRNLTAQLIKPDGPLHACHILYIAAREAEQAVTVIELITGAPVFTVGDCDRFVDAGGVAQLVNENGRMRFVISLPAAHRARLAVSAKLLGLARDIRQ
jgi:uncharacterized protein DUF4154